MKRFFQWAVLAPYIVGGVGLLLSPIYQEARFLFGPLIFGGIPYIPFAIGLWLLIGRCNSKAQLVQLSLVAPLAFLPLVIGFVFLLGSAPQMTVEDYLRDIKVLLVLSLAWSYAYVGLVWLAFGIFSGAKLVARGVAP